MKARARGVTGRPAARWGARPSPAGGRIPDALPRREWGPGKAGAKRPPTVAVAAAGKPGTIVVQVGKSGSVVGRIRVLQRRRCGGAYTVNAARDPPGKVVLIQKEPTGQRRMVTGPDRKRLARFELRRGCLVPNGNAR